MKRLQGIKNTQWIEEVLENSPGRRKVVCHNGKLRIYYLNDDPKQMIWVIASTLAGEDFYYAHLNRRKDG